jgi:hypothetical protein
VSIYGIYLSINWVFNFNHLLKFFVKSWQNFQNTLHFFLLGKKKKKKRLEFRYWLDFNGICKKTIFFKKETQPYFGNFIGFNEKL